MKKKSSRIASGIKKLENIFKIRYWLDFERVRDFFLYLVNSVKNLFQPAVKTSSHQSFNKVVTRIGITAPVLDRQAHALLWWSRILLLVSFGILAIGIYHGMEGNIRAALLSILVMLVGICLSFRYHYLHFLIRERKLGCSLDEWFKCGLLGRRD